MNVNTLEHMAAKTLELNQIGICNLYLDRPMPFDPYRRTGTWVASSSSTGMTNNTVGVGLMHFALRRADNVHWQAIEVDQERTPRSRASAPPWSGSPGSPAPASRPSPTSSSASCTRMGRHTYLLDGDNLRHGLNQDLGFTDGRPGRERPPHGRGGVAHGRRRPDRPGVTHLARTGPSAAWPATWSARTGSCEVYVDTPLEVAEARDRKGLYAKARRGEIPNFTGIGAPYEAPDNPDVHIPRPSTHAEAAADAVIRLL